MGGGFWLVGVDRRGGVGKSRATTAVSVIVRLHEKQIIIAVVVGTSIRLHPYNSTQKSARAHTGDLFVLGLARCQTPRGGLPVATG